MTPLLIVENKNRERLLAMLYTQFCENISDLVTNAVF